MTYAGSVSFRMIVLSLVVVIFSSNIVSISTTVGSFSLMFSFSSVEDDDADNASEHKETKSELVIINFAFELLSLCVEVMHASLDTNRGTTSSSTAPRY